MRAKEGPAFLEIESNCNGVKEEKQGEGGSEMLKSAKTRKRLGKMVDLLLWI